MRDVIEVPAEFVEVVEEPVEYMNRAPIRVRCRVCNAGAEHSDGLCTAHHLVHCI